MKKEIIDEGKWKWEVLGPMSEAQLHREMVKHNQIKNGSREAKKEINETRKRKSIKNY